MEKITSIKDFRKFQDHLVTSWDTSIPTIVIPAGTCGQASGSNGLIRIAKREILAKGLTGKIHLRITGCHGFCQMEPSVLIEPYGTFYPKVDLKNIARIVEAVAKGEVLEDLLFVDPGTGNKVEKQSEIPFFKKQVRTILSGSEKVDPIHINDYIKNGGYSALTKVLTNGDPEWVIKEVKASGLRGRGGAGFSTGRKWELLAKQPGGRPKFLVCNADEGDPGAYMDRSVLEGNPHSIIEGMIIGAYGTRAAKGVVYVRNEYPLAIKHLVIALRQARELGLLGDDILGTGFSFDIRIVKGAGAFVCGEETALIASIEGKMGEPHQRPPFPVQKGINGCPTAINNVETWANIPVIIKKGAVEFAKVGTKNNCGTKIFSLVGKVKYTGLVEVPMGITIREIVYDIGGGPVGKVKIKAVQTGGPSGGCIPAEKFDLNIDYDSLTSAGSIMGSGGMIVMDENTCMVDTAKYFMNFLKDESCGKCFTCRKGTQRMYEILEGISNGDATLSNIDLLRELALVVKDTTMCGLGQTASNPVLSTLKYFHNEYKSHIWDKKCSAFVCKDLVGAPCQSACPLGTEAWRYVAHVARGEYEESYKAIREANPFPSICARVCNHPCENRCRSGTSGKKPIAIRALKRFVTDRIDPGIYNPARVTKMPADAAKIAVVGAGPAGLTAAHYLSLKGYKVTIFEADDHPGGMLLSCIPAYRLPREILKKEIKSLMNENITVKCNTLLGKDLTIEDIFGDGFKAVFLAIGAHKSRKLGIKGEDAKGIYSSIKFLKEFNLHGEKLASGRVGIIGGGNSAVDGARTALRQEGVENVTIFYRRTKEEMPAFSEEVDAAINEGIKLEALVSPVEVQVKDGQITGVKFIRNKLGELDSDGRRKPIPIKGSEFIIPMDTLIVAISEEHETDLISMGCKKQIETSASGAVKVELETLCTSKEGVFAGGDLIRGPSTIVEAIADGKQAAVMIDRYLRKEELKQPSKIKRPQVYVEPVVIDEKQMEGVDRVSMPFAKIKEGKMGFEEVELTLSVGDATLEAKRCLRCDLEYTQQKNEEQKRK